MELLGERLCAFVLVIAVTPSVFHRSCANRYGLTSKIQKYLLLSFLANMDVRKLLNLCQSDK